MRPRKIADVEREPELAAIEAAVLEASGLIGDLPDLGTVDFLMLSRGDTKLANGDPRAALIDFLAAGPPTSSSASPSSRSRAAATPRSPRRWPTRPVERDRTPAGSGIIQAMPELPEVEIAARRLDEALRGGAVVESTMAPGMVALKSIKPPLEELVGMRVTGVGRRGKMPHVDFTAPDGGSDREPLSLLIHMMSAGRLQLFDKRASLRDKRSRILIRLAGDPERELRLREFGTKQRAWGRLLPTAELDAEEMVATLGPEAWPAPPIERLREVLDQSRQLHPMLREQRTIAGIGRSWVDEILWEARLSPFKKGSELDADELGRLHAALALLGGAIEHYEEVIGPGEVPDKMPMPLQVHRREGEPCPRCGDEIAAIHYSEHICCYCPSEQNGGKRFADRRLSRLLK